MARPKKSTSPAAASGKRPIEQYTHDQETRINNPPVGLVDAASDSPEARAETYSYDPHLAPELQFDLAAARSRLDEAAAMARAAATAAEAAVAKLIATHQKAAAGDKQADQELPKLMAAAAEAVRASSAAAVSLEKLQVPYLAWAGKAERTSFEVPTVSLHVHERIDPRSILEAVRKKNGSNYEQLSLWSLPGQNPPLRDAIEFYQHRHGWTNRLVAGDSLLVMNSLIEKEGMAGKVQMLYFDPPYGIRYGSNFQPFVNKRDVKDGKDEDLTAEPEMIKAFRDTWELGLHSYLAYLRDRLLLARDLLTESGSVFVQIGEENIHHVREILDEVFGTDNFVSQVTFQKTTGATVNYLPGTCDFILWYSRNKSKVKFRPLYLNKELGMVGAAGYTRVLLPDGEKRMLMPFEMSNPESLPTGSKIYTLDNITSQSVGRQKGDGAACWFPVNLSGKVFRPHAQGRWKTNESGMENLRKSSRLEAIGDTLRYVRFLDDFPVFPLGNVWNDTTIAGYASDKVYVVQTTMKVVQRCMLMSTDPGDLVLDITCGSGTTAMVAEQWGRRWITCDTSRVALTLAKQRLMTAVFDYYQLAYPDEGVGSGFRYKKVPHVTLKSIANNEPPAEETLYDQPLTDSKKARVCGPFTVEAVPAPVVNPVANDEAGTTNDELPPLGAYLGRQGETLRQEEWRQELLRTGIRGKNGQYLMFSRVEPLPGTRWLHAEGETRPDERGGPFVRDEANPRGNKRVVLSFGPAHAPLEQRQVEQALEEASHLVPKPSLLVFAAFQFDPEAAKDIDETRWPGVTLLKVQMNADLLTDDLKKKRASNDSFWMVGQPDIHLRQIHKGDNAGLWECEVLGFDYFNPKTGEIESGGPDRIAMWMLDTDYDGRSLFPRQVFFPMAGDKEGWAKLARNLKAEIDDVMIEAYRGTLSVPFELGKHRRVAVKIVDDRGIESLKIVNVITREEYEARMKSGDI
jgi:adenine-specific DNA-methyltransferase